MLTVEVLKTDLLAARKRRDKTTEAALKRAIARIESAEAPPAVPVSSTQTEVERLVLTDADVRACLQAELDEALAAATLYERGGRRKEADRLRAESSVLEDYLAR